MTFYFILIIINLNIFDIINSFLLLNNTIFNFLNDNIKSLNTIECCIEHDFGKIKKFPKSKRILKNKKFKSSYEIIHFYHRYLRRSYYKYNYVIF